MRSALEALERTTVPRKISYMTFPHFRVIVEKIKTTPN